MALELSCQRQAQRSRYLKPLLVGCGLPPDDDWLVEQGDIAGWTSWRRLAETFDARLARHADSVLARYNKLTNLPTVRIDMRTGCAASRPSSW